MSDFFAEKLGQKCCIVGAHPDDEVLFAAALPIRYPDRDWTIICCSIPRRDPIRAWKFFDACEALGARGRLMPVVESEPNENPTGLQLLDLKSFDCVVTHNDEGEYGHVHHRAVHRAVISRLPKNVITFGYRHAAHGKYEIRLNRDELQRKTQALRCYDHITPYEGRDVPKWRALVHRYFEVEGIDPSVETYD